VDQQRGSNDSLVLSYLDLRKAIGIIGIALPFVLAFGKMLFEGPGIQNSISSYYHTEMRDVFVGSLCAIAMFLLCYRGYERIDAIAGDVACVFALGVALFPTTPAMNATPQDKIIGALHLTFAVGFFLTLAFFALALFRKTDPTRTPTRRKLQRNVVYTICGYAIIACLVLIVVVALISDDSPVKRLDPVFWLESAAIVAFGVSWLTKGEAILEDVET
jgi:amino acid transporter